MRENVLTSSDKPRSIMGVRVTALNELALFLIAALALDHFLGVGDRFADLAPHPFWIAVLLASAYYGTNEGLAAAGLATAALLIGNVPEQAIGEDLPSWLLRFTKEPVLWFAAAVVIGEMRTAQRRDSDALRAELKHSQDQAAVISGAYERLARLNRSLEERIASARLTVRTLATAAQAIEHPTCAEVFAGIPDLVRVVFAPPRFSVFRLQAGALDLVFAEGWSERDAFRRRIETGPLFDALVGERQALTVANPAHEALLGSEGLLAAPVIGSDGLVLGIIKIEDIGFSDLTPATYNDLRVLCEWIGHAHDRATRQEAGVGDRRAADFLRDIQVPSHGAPHAPAQAPGRVRGTALDGSASDATDILGHSPGPYDKEPKSVELVVERERRQARALP